MNKKHLLVIFWLTSVMALYGCVTGTSADDLDASNQDASDTDIGTDTEPDIGTDAGIDADTGADTDTFVPSGYALRWGDEFNDFDETNWTKGLHFGDPALSLNDNYGGANTDEDVYIENGNLVLRNQKRAYSGFEYTTGWIQSKGKRHVYGASEDIYIELRAQFPTGNKVWPAIWLTGVNRWPPEIDIWEYFGNFFDNNNRLDEMALRYIYGECCKPPQKKSVVDILRQFDEKYDAAAWHIYGFELTKEAMIWWIDGQEVGRHTKGVDVPVEGWPLDPQKNEFFFMLNNGVMSWVEDVNTQWPNYLTIDYFRVYYK